MSGSSIDQNSPEDKRPIMPTTTVAPATEHKLEMRDTKSSSSSTAPQHNIAGEQRVRRRPEQKTDGSFKGFTGWLIDNQIVFSFNLVALLLLTHYFVPKARHFTAKFILTSHYNPNTGQYAVGGDDFCLLAFYVTLFTGARASVMEYVLAPLAKRWGISKKKDVTRFAEQAWLLCYYSVFWSIGLYLYCTSKYFLNLREMFTDWPTRELPGLTKAYILGQWAFWLQQIIVINIEKRRKDHWQMLAHHIVTVVLISTSYALHLTRVANLILILMDVVDIFFPLAKCLKYLGYSTLRDIMFGFFMVSWFVARHIFYIIAMWSIWTDMAEIIPIGCYSGSQDNLVGPTPLPEHGWSHMLEPFRNPEGIICYSDNVRWGFLGALGFLQALTIVWFFMIVQVAIRVLKGIGADDIRSDDESEVQEHDDMADVEYRGAQVLEVGVEAIDLAAWQHRKRTATSSGVSLTRRSDRKELLNRIGCEKQVE